MADFFVIFLLTFEKLRYRIDARIGNVVFLMCADWRK